MSHSKFSPSARRRWANCPGSVRLIEDLDLPEVDTVYSLEGSEAHSLAAAALVHDANPTNSDIGLYVDFVRSLPGAKLVEEQLKDPSNPDIYGTPDALVYDFGGTLWVIDFKYGEGVAVSPSGNPQLEMYAVLAFANGMEDVSEVRLAIVQPRAENSAPQIESYPAGQVAVWRDTILAEMEACELTDAPLVSGQHCQFCPAKAHCPELRGKTQLTAGHATMLPVEQLRPEQLNWLLENRKRVRDYLTAVEDYALQQALAGNLPGWKAVGSLKNREWVNPDEAMKAMKKLGHKLDEVAPRKLISPAQADRLLDRKWVELMVKREPGGPRLVKDNAPGEPINVLAHFDEVKGAE